MPGKFLLDTSILVGLLRKEPLITSRLANAEEVFVNTIALGELYFGARRSARPQESRARVDALAADLTELVCDTDTAEAYAALKERLWRKGTPIPDNDLWIAASAAQYGLTLAVRDRHFQAVDGINLVDW